MPSFKINSHRMRGEKKKKKKGTEGVECVDGKGHPKAKSGK